MNRRLTLAVVAATLTSCSSQPGFYETENADAVPIYRSMIGRIPEPPAILLKAYDRERVDPSELKRTLAAYDLFLAEVARAARARRCEWTYDKMPAFTDPYPMDYGITVGRVLGVRSRLRFAKGDVDGALEDLLVLSRFGSDLAQDRWTIGKLIGLIDIVFAASEIRDRIAGGYLQPEHFERLLQGLAAIERRFPAYEAFLRDERQMALPLLERIRDTGIPEGIAPRNKQEPRDPPLVAGRWEGWLRTTLIRDLEGTKARVNRRWEERMLPFEEDAQRPIHARTFERHVQGLNPDGHEVVERMARTLARSPIDPEAALIETADLLLFLWLPALAKVGPNLANARLLVTFNRIACRLELRRQSAGVYPDALDPPVEDPYTGKPLLYRRVVRPEGEGYVLASAGPRDDAETRMRVLSDDCRFDWTLMDKKGYGDADAHTMGVFRTRDSLR